ncbi:MAG: hypothetical protein KME13_03905 [Myxacorys californica WJT36-NPBG1]|jgi:hypothetical protein|nr:hypothetical protein [Myxacorys californica WJT36-NPBG1]
MREFLIKCLDDDWSLPYERWLEVFHPNSLTFKRLPGNQYRIEVMKVPIYFAHEPPGIYLCVEGKLPDIIMSQIVNEVLSNLQQVTGQEGEIIDQSSIIP